MQPVKHENKISLPLWGRWHGAAVTDKVQSGAQDNHNE